MSGAVAGSELPLNYAEAYGTGESAPLASVTQSLPPARLPSQPGVSRSTLRDWLIDSLLSPAFRALIATATTWEWADARHIPTEHGGQYLSRRRPHCRRFMAKFTDPAIREQHVMKASRSGFTEGALNRVRQMAEEDPGNVQFCAGSKKNSIELNNARLIPSLRYLGIFASGAVDPDDVTSEIIRLTGMSVRISGAYTAGAFRTNAIKFFVNDDCELVTDIPGIGSPADGARSRIRGIDGAQLVSISRPTDWATPHHRDVASGTLEFFAVPCPHCGTFQELTIDGTSLVSQLRIEEDPTSRGGPALNAPLTLGPNGAPRLGRLKFDHCKLLPGLAETGNRAGWDYNRIISETYYECVSGCEIRQDDPLTDADLANPLCSFSDEVKALHLEGVRLTHKQAMAISGRHIASNPNPIPADGGGPRSKRSEHNCDLVCLDVDMTWGHFAKKLAERAHDPANLRNFLNEHAGLPWRQRSAAVGDDHILECRAAYERRTLPFVPDIMVLCADSQLAYRKWVCVGARLDSTSKAWRDIAVSDWGYAALKSDLLAQLSAPYTLSPLALATSPGLTAIEDRKFFPAIGLVDAGGADGNTDEVYELHFESGQRFFPSFGRGGQTAELRPTWTQELKNGWRGTNIFISYYWDDFWKRKLYLGSLQKARQIKQCQEKDRLDPSAQGLPARLWLPGSPADARRREFEAELKSEHINDKGDWQVTSGVPNDFGDGLKECYVMLDFILPRVAAERARQKAEASKSSP